MINLTESQINQAFEFFHSELMEEDLVLVDNQPKKDHGLKTDLIFKDKNDQRILLEIRSSTITKPDIEHLLVKNIKFKLIKTRIILAAPFIPKTTRKALEKNGIEFIQFSKDDIHKLYEDSELPINKTETVRSQVRDGNVAFKVEYNKEDWNHVFSEELAAYNFKHRTWHQQEKSQDNPQIDFSSLIKEDTTSDFKLDDILSTEDDEAMTSLHAKLGKIAVFTSLEPGQHERERFIFAMAQMTHIEPSENTKEGIDGFHCDKDTALIFKTNRPKFWKYYSNVNSDLAAWNMGLFRYLKDDVVISLLTDISETNIYPKTFKKKAKFLLQEM